MMELISVIVPVYNVKLYLVRCLDSIISQTYKHIEIILVDDGSTDGSQDICDEYVKKFSNIRVVHKENGGLSSARNIGLEMAAGAYIFFVDSDDFISSETLQTLLMEMKKNQADIAMCGYQKVDENGEILTDSRSSVEKVYLLTGKELLIKNECEPEMLLSVVWNKLYKRKFFENLRFAVGKVHEDEFIFHKICIQCNLIVSVKKGMYYYTQRTDSIMGRGITEKNMDVFEAYFDRIVCLKKMGLQEVCDRVMNSFYRVVIRYSLVIGYDNYELNYRVRSYWKDIIKILPVLLKCSSLNRMEKIKFCIWFFSPQLYGRLWELKNVKM